MELKLTKEQADILVALSKEAEFQAVKTPPPSELHLLCNTCDAYLQDWGECRCEHCGERFSSEVCPSCGGTEGDEMCPKCHDGTLYYADANPVWLAGYNAGLVVNDA
jgi:hypothetical protein